MTQRYQYIGCCVHLDGDAVNAMKDAAREVCLSTFARAVDHQDWQALKRQLGYGKLFRIESDCYISFARSSYNGKACAYMTHSAIEYVFTEVR